MKTLFQFIRKETYNSDYYYLKDKVIVEKINDIDIIINPIIGSWVLPNKVELNYILKNHKKIINKNIGKFLFKLGICDSNNPKNNVYPESNLTDELYFFEFSLTNICNLSCTYCFADANSMDRKYASKEMGTLFIDRIAEYKSKIKSTKPIVVEFTGGEPLLNFETLKHTVDYANCTYREVLDIHFTLQTNLTSLTDEQLSFFIDNDISIGISCDGYAKIHNSQRPFNNGKESHDILVKKIAKVRKKYKYNSGGAIAVITGTSQNYMPEIALYLVLLGFDNFVLRPMTKLGRGQDNLDTIDELKYVDGLFQVLDSVLYPLYNEKNIIIKERHLALTFSHLLNSEKNYMCETTPCGGAKNICIITCEGDVYPCNQSIQSNFLLGNIASDDLFTICNNESGYNFKSRDLSNIDECSNCLFRGWCNSPCTVATFEKFKDPNKKSAYCKIMLNRYKKGLELLISNAYSLNFITSLCDINKSLTWQESPKDNILDVI